MAGFSRGSLRLLNAFRSVLVPAPSGKPASVLSTFRTSLEATVLGDPDMRTLVELEQLAPIVKLEHFRKDTYFVALLKKPDLPISNTY